MRSAWISLVALSVLLVALIPGCEKKAPVTTPDKGASVSVALVAKRDLDEHVAVTGTLLPVNEVLVGPKLAGRIVAVIGANHQVSPAGVPLGVTVKAHEVVAVMDDSDARNQILTATAAVRAAKAAAESADARVEQAKAAYRQQRAATDAGILNAKAAEEAAKARLTQAQSTKTALASSTEAQIKQAEQALSAAKSKRDEVYNGSRDQERRVAENSVALAKANLDYDISDYNSDVTLQQQGALAQTIVDAAKNKMKVAQATYDSAKEQLDLIQQGARQEDKDTADAGVRQAQAALDSATAGRDQVKAAEDNVSIARTGIDQAQAALDTANAALDTDVMRDKDVLAARAAADQARAAVQQAEETKINGENTLANTFIRSPVDGVIAEQLAQVGQSIAAAITVLRITTDQALVFQAKISELDAARLAPGQSVSLSVDAEQGDRGNLYAHTAPSSLTDCTVERVVPVVDAKSRSFIVRVIVKKSVGLYPGMFARGVITVARHLNVIAVPKDAVLTSNGRQILFTVESQANGPALARQHAVSLGASDGDYLQVLSGVKVGDQVITVGQQSLNDGDKIAVTP